MVKDGGAHGAGLDPGGSVDPGTCPKQANQTPTSVSRITLCPLSGVRGFRPNFHWPTAESEAYNLGRDPLCLRGLAVNAVTYDAEGPGFDPGWRKIFFLFN